MQLLVWSSPHWPVTACHLLLRSPDLAMLRYLSMDPLLASTALQSKQGLERLWGDC